jgi:tyrosine-protein phosphatase YwqE
MGLFSFISKNKENHADKNYLPLDFHSHLIPTIDDGSKSLEESLDIISFFKNKGVKKMITTPHISMDYFPNTRDDILKRFDEFRRAVADAGMDMELGLGAEYMIDDGFKKIVDEKKFLTFGNNYLLVELGTFSEHPDFSARLFDLQCNGYQVILAHPERYSFWHRNKDIYFDLKEREIFFQLNLLSLTNIYSSEVNAMARWLIDNKLIDFVGSDVHHNSQLQTYSKAINSPLFAKMMHDCDIKNTVLF